MDNHLEGQVCSHRPLSVSGTTTMLLLPIFASAVRIVNFGTEPISITTGASSSQTFKNTMPPFRASSTPSSSSSIIAYNHFLLRLNQTSSFTNLVTMSLLVVFLPLHYLSHSVTLLLALVWGSPLLLVLQAA
ncbi:hypothetical protein DVH24_008380 [Malus domestica]|uniref:Uncharacterized protein n=1 Tax=Malus domestica TaxID=3750 RepID=A0A498JK01_MALDO|nr:hypothetical protein DVH24_008380 [Malus domestica]